MNGGIMAYCRDCRHYEAAADPDKGFCSGVVVWGRRDAADCPFAAYRPRPVIPPRGDMDVIAAAAEGRTARGKER